jgi:hypothetical protein
MHTHNAMPTALRISGSVASISIRKGMLSSFVEAVTLGWVPLSACTGRMRRVHTDGPQCRRCTTSHLCEECQARTEASPPRDASSPSRDQVWTRVYLCGPTRCPSQVQWHCANGSTYCYVPGLCSPTEGVD